MRRYRLFNLLFAFFMFFAFGQGLILPLVYAETQSAVLHSSSSKENQSAVGNERSNASQSVESSEAAGDVESAEDVSTLERLERAQNEQERGGAKGGGIRESAQDTQSFGESQSADVAQNGGDIEGVEGVEDVIEPPLAPPMYESQALQPGSGKTEALRRRMDSMIWALWSQAWASGEDQDLWQGYRKAVEAWAAHPSVKRSARGQAQAYRLLSLLNQPQVDRAQFFKAYAEVVSQQFRSSHPLVKAAHQMAVLSPQEVHQKYEQLSRAYGDALIKSRYASIKPLASVAYEMADQSARASEQPTQRSGFVSKIKKLYSWFTSSYVRAVASAPSPSPVSASVPAAPSAVSHASGARVSVTSSSAPSRADRSGPVVSERTAVSGALRVMQEGLGQFSVLSAPRAECSVSEAPHRLTRRREEMDQAEDEGGTLITEERDPETHKRVMRLGRALSQETYESIVQLNDLSYSMTKLHIQKSERDQAVHQARIDTHVLEQEKKGWRDHKLIFGKTGKDNRDDDGTCLLSYNSRTNTIAVTFHGSSSGSVFRAKFLNDASGDWGANYDEGEVSGSILGLDPGLRLHKGFAHNLSSVKAELEKQIKLLTERIRAEGKGKPWVMVSGHSKGGAMASLAAPMLKKSLGNSVHVGAVLFSAPRAVKGDQSQAMINQALDARNILRINVKEDKVPVANMKWRGWRSVGTPILDSSDQVKARIRAKYGLKASKWRHLGVDADLGRGGGWAAEHYGTQLRGRPTFEYDPSAVLPYSELQKKVRGLR